MMKALTAVVLCGVFATGAPPQPESSVASSALPQPYAHFGFDVLRELRSHHPDGNVFISPTSIAVALAMTSNGASGTTREAILKTLHADGQSIDAFNAANRELAEQMAKTTSVQLSMANALWLEQELPVNPSFVQTLESAFGAHAQNVNFRSPAALEAINAWVAEHTNNRIERILDNVDPATIAVLTNAIAFKGKWTAAFDPKMTQQHEFKTGSGAARQVQMMKHTAEYRYANTDGLEVIRLPYADGSFAMYVVLPQDATRMQSFVEKLTPEAFTELLSSLRTQNGTIELPRFTTKYDTTLNTVLKKLGMGIAFSDSANFNDISKAPKQFQISEVRHGSFLSVDEEGTEAAAATSVGIRATAMRVEPPPFHMVVDHPFCVAIRDERNGQLLFTGVIAEPEG
jgi:serpin B